jgi:hypothetical protein
MVELMAVNDVRCQVPALAGVAQAEALIQRGGIEGDVGIAANIGSEQIADAEAAAEISRQLPGKERIENAGVIIQMPDTDLDRGRHNQ